MVYKFEGKTEKEAIDNAVEALGLDRDQFDVEIVNTEKGGFLNLSKKVTIDVHINDQVTDSYSMEPENDIEHGITDFVRNVVEKMGIPAEVELQFREANKIGLKIDSQQGGILIGRKGKTLDALQLLTNVVAHNLTDASLKVIIDTENYRSRREEQLVRLAQKVGDEVKRTRKSKLLEPMNPFERRIVHTTLSDISDIHTESEGEGLHKQVRISYRGA